MTSNFICQNQSKILKLVAFNAPTKSQKCNGLAMVLIKENQHHFVIKEITDVMLCIVIIFVIQSLCDVTVKLIIKGCLIFVSNTIAKPHLKLLTKKLGYIRGISLYIDLW